MKIAILAALSLSAMGVHAVEKFLCYGDQGNYVVLTEGVNEPPATLIVCWKGGYACDQEVALQEDTDDDSGVRRFVSISGESPEYWLQLTIDARKDPQVSATMILEREGEIIESAAVCDRL